MLSPHKFEPVRLRGSVRCRQCGLDATAGIHSYSLPGMDTTEADRAEAKALAEREALEAKMREPLANIDRRTGDIERDSPLFFGTGNNPTLF